MNKEKEQKLRSRIKELKGEVNFLIGQAESGDQLIGDVIEEIGQCVKFEAELAIAAGVTDRITRKELCDLMAKNRAELDDLRVSLRKFLWEKL